LQEQRRSNLSFRNQLDEDKIKYENEAKEIRLQMNTLIADQGHLAKEQMSFEETKRNAELEIARTNKELEEIKAKTMKLKEKVDAGVIEVNAEKKKLAQIRVIIDGEKFDVKNSFSRLEKRETALLEKESIVAAKEKSVTEREIEVSNREKERENRDKQIDQFRNVLNDGT